MIVYLNAEPDEHESTKESDKEKYRELCADSKIVPCSYFLAHIKDDKMLLRYHQFNTADIQAITKTLIVACFLLVFYRENPFAVLYRRTIQSNSYHWMGIFYNKKRQSISHN